MNPAAGAWITSSTTGGAQKSTGLEVRTLRLVGTSERVGLSQTM